MGREIRKVRPDWVHPKNCFGLVPLFEGYAEDAKEFEEMAREKGESEAIEYFGQRPNPDEYMPDWTPEEATHFQMYENTSEGTPISPVFATPEEVARWCADNGASAFADMTASYEQWLAVARGGWAPSCVVDAGGMRSGVEAVGDLHPGADQ